MMLLAFWPNERWYVPGLYGHVTIAEHSDETWTLIDVGLARAEVQTFWRKADIEDQLSRLTQSCLIVKYEGGPRRGFLLPLTCVSFARHYSGVPSRALFPDALLRDLLRNGAEVIHEPSQSSREQRSEAESA